MHKRSTYYAHREDLFELRNSKNEQKKITIFFFIILKDNSKICTHILHKYVYIISKNIKQYT